MTLQAMQLISGGGMVLAMISVVHAMIGHRGEIEHALRENQDLLDRAREEQVGIRRRIDSERAAIAATEESNRLMANENDQLRAGMSAYQIAVAEGFGGDERAWLDSLHEPRTRQVEVARLNRDGREAAAGRQVGPVPHRGRRRGAGRGPHAGAVDRHQGGAPAAAAGAAQGGESPSRRGPGRRRAGRGGRRRRR